MKPFQRFLLCTVAAVALLAPRPARAATGAAVDVTTNTATYRVPVRLKKGPLYDAKAWGAVGDGSTDDTAAIQAMFDACQVITGCTAFFPAGIYKISSQLTYTGNSIDVLGENPDRSVIKASSATQNILHFSSGGNGSVRRMGFSYTVFRSTGSAIFFDTWGSAQIENCSFVGQWLSVRLETANFVVVKDTLIQPTTATTSVGILVHGGIEQTLDHVTINGDTTNQPKAGVEITSSGGIWLTQVEVNHGGIGILIDPTGTDEVNPIHMSHNILDSNNSGAGIKISPSASARVGFLKATNESWSSNGVVGGGYGMDLDGAGTIVDIRVSNSEIANNGSHGVHYNAGTDVHFVGNSIIGNSQSSANTYSDVWVGAGNSKFSFIGNRMGTTAGFASTKEKYGLEIAAGGADQYQVIGNNFYTTNTGGFSDGGTGANKTLFANIPQESNDYLKISSGTVTALRAGSVTDTGLTSGRLALVSTGGLLADSSAITYSGGALTATSFAGSGASITGISGSNVSGGTFGAVNGSAITNISGSNVSGGTFGAVNGSALTALNASNLASGTVADARLSSNVPLKDTAATLTGAYTISGATNGNNWLTFTDTTQSFLWGVRGDTNHVMELYNATAGSDVVVFTTTSRMGLGTEAPSAQLHTTSSVRFASFGAGAATFDANGNVSSVSDVRMKDVQCDFTKGLSTVLQLKPKNYKWKASTGFDTVNVYTGFVAQDVAAVLPEAAWKNKDGMYSLQDRPIEAALVNAVKELSKKVDDLTARIAVLEKKK